MQGQCDICDLVRPYKFEIVHDVSLCPNCHENHRRGLLPLELLEQFKSGEWKPYEPDNHHKLKVAKSRVSIVLGNRKRRRARGKI